MFIKKFKKYSTPVAIFSLILAEMIIGMPIWNARAEEDQPPEVTDGLWVSNPSRSTYLFNWCNNSYLRLKLKEGTQGTDFLSLWFDGIPLVATYGGINTWAFEMEDTVHNVTFDAGTEVYVESMWVQPVLLANENVTVQLDEWNDVSFKAGGDCVLLLQANFSYLDLGVKINGITLKDKHSYMKQSTDPYPDADCATVAGGIEGSTWNKFSFSLDAPGIQNLSFTGEGWINYAIVGAGLDFDADKIYDDVEVEHFGEPGYHPTLASSWGYYLYTEAHPTYWDDLDQFYENVLEGQTSPEMTTQALVEAFAFYVPSAWSDESMNLYVDVASGVAENFSLDNEPVLFNETVFGWDFVMVNGTSLQGLDKWGNLLTVSTDDSYAVGTKFLSKISAGWHLVDWWIDAEVNYYLGTQVNLRINEYTIPIIADPPAQDSDLDGFIDDWEDASGANAGRYDSDFDGLEDEADLSVGASLWCPVGTLTEFIYHVRTPQDIRVEMQVKPLELDENLTMPLSWQPDVNGPQSQVVCIPAIRIMGPGNCSIDGAANIDIYWRDKTSLAAFWEKSIQSYSLAPAPSNVVSGNCDPLPSENNPKGANYYYDFIFPSSQAETSWEFQFTYCKTHPALGDHFLDLVFDLVFVLVNSSWSNSSDNSILRWYEVDQPVLLQGMRITEISNVASALGSPDSACENQIIYTTLQNPALGNPTAYGLSGASGSDVDVLYWDQGQSFYPAFEYNETNPATYGAAQKLAVARKARPRQDNESEVTYYGMDELTYDALGLMNISGRIDPAGDPYGIYSTSNMVGNIAAGSVVNAQGSTVPGWWDCSSPLGSVKVVEQAKNHRNALYFHPYIEQVAGCRTQSPSPLTSGVISFWIMAGAATSQLEVQITGNGGYSIGPRLHIQQGRLWAEYYNGTETHHDICAIWPNEMFLIQVFFDATDIDGDGYGNFTLSVLGAGAGFHQGKFLDAFNIDFNAIEGIKFMARMNDVFVDGVNFAPIDGALSSTQEETSDLLHAKVSQYRKSFYIISDLYSEYFSPGDPELQGQDDLVWQTSYVSLLHEKKQVDYNGWPIEISIMNFPIADILQISRGYGDIDANVPSPQNMNDLQLSLYDPLILTQDYYIEPTNDALHLNLTILPPPLNFGVVDDLKSDIDLREDQVNHIESLFERESYSIWEWFLWRIQYLKWLTGRITDVSTQIADIIEQYYPGWSTSADIKIKGKGIALLPEDKVMIEGWSDADWEALGVDPRLKAEILLAYKTIGTNPVYICTGETFKQTITGRTLASWMRKFPLLMESFFDEISKCIGEKTFEYILEKVRNDKGEVIKKVFKKQDSFVTFSKKAKDYLSLLHGKAIRIYGVGFSSRFSQSTATEKRNALNDKLIWGLEAGLQFRFHDVPRTEWLLYPWEGAGRLFFDWRKTGEMTIDQGIFLGYTGAKGTVKQIGGGLAELIAGAVVKSPELQSLYHQLKSHHSASYHELNSMGQVLRTSTCMPNFDYVKRRDLNHPNELVDRSFNFRKTYLAILFAGNLLDQMRIYFRTCETMPSRVLFDELYLETMGKFLESLYEIPGAPQIVIQKFLEQIVGTPFEIQLFDPRVQDNLHEIINEIKNNPSNLIPFGNTQYQNWDRLEDMIVWMRAILNDPHNPQGTRFRALQETALRQTRIENRLLMKVEQAKRKLDVAKKRRPWLRYIDQNFYVGRSWNKNEQIYFNQEKGVFSVPNYVFHSMYGIMSYKQASEVYGYNMYLYDGYIPNDAPTFDPVLMAWMWNSRSHARLPGQNVINDIARQWVSIALQGNITEEKALITQLTTFALSLISMGLFGMFQGVMSTTIQNPQSIPQYEPPLVQGFWDFDDWRQLPNVVMSFMYFINLFYPAAAVIMAPVALLMIGMGFQLLGIIMDITKLLEIQSRISAVQNLIMTLPEQTRRDYIRHGALEVGDNIDLTFSITNTGYIHWVQELAAEGDVITTRWRVDGGNGSDLVFHARAALCGRDDILPAGGEGSRPWIPWQDISIASEHQYEPIIGDQYSSPAGSAAFTLSVTPTEATVNPCIFWQTYFTPKTGDSTPQQPGNISLSQFGLSVTETTLTKFLEQANPTELSRVWNKTGDYLLEVLSGRFKDAADKVDQAIDLVGFNPYEFNATFGNAIPKYQGEAVGNDLHIDRCLDCGANFNKTLGYCTRCGWKLDHYGVHVAQYPGPGGWHDLMTQYFAEGFRALCPTRGGAFFTPTIEWQASDIAQLDSFGMILVPADWLASKNQSMTLLRALCAARANFTLNANLDVTPSWGGILEVPANGTASGRLYFTVEGSDNPAVKADLILPDGFAGALYTGHYKGTESFTAGIDWADWILDWGTGDPNVGVTPWYLDHRNVMCVDDSSLTKTIRAGYDFVNKPQARGTVEFWVANPNAGPDQALSWSLDESTYFYNYYPLITGMLKAGQIWTTNGASQVVVGTYDPAKWVHVRVAFGDPRVPLTYPYAFNYSLWIDGEFAGEFTYTHPEDDIGTFRGLSFFSTSLGTGLFYVDAIGYDFAPGYHVGDNWHLEDVPGEEVFPLQDLPSLEFEIHSMSSHTPAGFYTATVNITYTNGTRIMTITIPFRYAWDQSTGLEYLALPDIVIPGDVVRWGKVTNTGTEPGAFLVDSDGLPADWLQSTGRVALAHVGFDQGLDGFTLASTSSVLPNFTFTQPIQVATFIDYHAPDTCFGAAALIIPGYPDWAYFGVPNLPPDTPFVAPRGTSASFFMDYAEHDAPYSTWDVCPAPSLDEGTLTAGNIPDMGEWWKNMLYTQPSPFALDWVQFPNLAPGGNYILELGPSRFRLRSDDFPDIATRPFAGTFYDKACADAGTLVIQTNEPETITLTKPVTWALQAGDTITVRYSINGPGHATLNLGGQSFELIPAGNTQYGSQTKLFTIAQNMTITTITIEADLAAGTVYRVNAITAERPLTLSQQASSGIAGGIYTGTLDLHDAIGYSSLASYAFDSGTEGWVGSFASGEKNFTVTDYMALTYVDQRNPGSTFKGPEIVLSSSSYYMYAYLMDAYRERYFPGFIPEDFLLQLRFQHVVPATLWAWACNPWDPVNYKYNGQPLSYDNQPWYFGKVVTSAATTGIPDGGWLTVHGMAPGPFFLFTDQLFGTMEVYGPSSFDNYPRTITVFENFGAAEGHLLFQAEQADSFTAHRAVDLQLRQGDRVRVAFTTTGTQLVTLRAGSITFTLVPAGNAAFGPQAAVFTIPADMHVTQLEIAGYLDAVQYLHVDTIAIERPAQVLPYVYGHRDVLALGAAAGNVLGAEYTINSPLTGTVEMWVAGSNLTAPLAIELAGDNGIARLGFEHEELRAWNGTNVITLASFSAWTGWTHLRVDFDLVTDTFTVWLNNVTVARDLLLTATGNVSTLQSIRLATTLGDHSYFADAIACSWIDVTYNLRDNLWPAWAAGCEQLFFVAPGESRSLEITVPRLYSIAPGPRQFVAKVMDPITRRLLGVYSSTVNVGAFYDIGLEVLPVHAAGMPGTQSTYVVRATNLGNVPQTISLTCAGSILAGWSFATPSATLAPGQTFASELAVDPAIFEAGVQWFTVLAGAALNSSAIAASYVVNDVPALSTPPDFSYESGTTGHEIRWNIEDTYLNSSVAAWNLSRAIFGDISLPVANGYWNDSREITVPVEGLSAGIFVYELAIQDGFGGTAQDTVVLVVTQDGVAYLPHVNSTDVPVGDNQTYATPLGNGTLEVAFNATAEVTLVVGAWDGNPTGLDPGFAGEGVYFAVEASHQAAVTFPMYVTVPLPAGIPPNATEQEIAEMIVPFTFDEVTSNWTQEYFAVTVDILDGTATVAVTHLSQFAVGVLNFPPTISCPPDLRFEVGTPGQAITWVVTDETVTRPMYQVTCNGIPLASGPWQAGMMIVIPMSEFDVGTYLLTASLSDGRGATVTDDMQVTVQPAITSIECGAVPDTAVGITLKITAIGASAVVVEFNGETYPTINAGNEYVAFLPNPKVIGAHAAHVTAWHGSISTSRDINIDVVNTAPRVRLYYANAASAGDYPATYTFSDRDPILFSTGWVAGVQNIPGQPIPGELSNYCRILPEHAGHADVLQLVKNASVAQVIAACFAGYEIPAGSVELWLAVEGDASFMAGLNAFTSGISGPWIVVVQEQLAVVSASGVVTMLGAFSPGWHRLRIDFAGAGTSIAGLAENHIALTLDDIPLGAIDAGAPLHVTGFAAAASVIGNAPSPATGSLYLDAVGFSYDPNYILGTNKYPAIDLTPRGGEPSPVPEVTIEAGDPNAIVAWVPMDLHYQDATYVLSRNGTAVDAGTWVEGTRIPLNLTGLAAGNYYFEVSLADGLGGVASQGIVVHVITTVEGLLRKAIADIELLGEDIADMNATVWRFLLERFASRAGANLAKALDLVRAGCTDRAAIRVWVARCQLRVADIITWVGDHVGGIDAALAARLHARIGSITAACGTLLDLLAGEWAPALFSLYLLAVD